MKGPIVQSLWVGSRLSAMERMTIQSFLASGHVFHLYCYDSISGVPAGTELMDAAAILPRERIFTYQSGFAAGSPAAFSNFFRYKLLLERGGWWVDTDVICLRPFDIPNEEVWTSEFQDPPLGPIVSTSVMRAQAGNQIMAWVWDKCQQVDTGAVMFGQIGPRLLQAALDALQTRARWPPKSFSPIPFFDWRKMLDPSQRFSFDADVYGVHLWNQMWSAEGVDKDRSFPGDCLYEQLKRRFASA